MEVQGILGDELQNVEIAHESWETVGPRILVMELLQSYPCASPGPPGGTPSRSPLLAEDDSRGRPSSLPQAGSEQGMRCHRKTQLG